MKIILTIALLATLTTYGQVPVSWECMATKTPDGYTLVVKGHLAKGWYVYAERDTSAGLEPIQIQPENNQIVLKTGPGYATTAAWIKDPVFNKRARVFAKEVAFTQPVTVNGPIPDYITVGISCFCSNGKEFLPVEAKVSVPLEGGVAASQSIRLNTIHLDKPVSFCGEAPRITDGLFGIFMLGIAGGLLALLTPCVFPMIPVTVSFFTGMDKKKAVTNGLLYGCSIIGIYLLASIPFHILGNINPQVFNTISTNAWVNLAFFLIFIMFALSFFGVFHIQLPSAFANRSGSKGGIFFMALTLAIVSFSCTGPILGSLLVGSLSSEGGAWELTAGMAGFGIALGLPFALFAMFPGWLKTLPKSGGWMDVVKKSLAFVELALAIKFLSNADLVKHWGILKREVFIGLWVLIALALALYLFGAFPGKKKITGLYIAGKTKTNLSFGRNFTAIIVTLFAIYLLPGLGDSPYANLRLLSGFAPPLSYSIYGKDNIRGKGLEPAVINDYDKALQLSKEQHKPVLIDFTGWACVNCRKMEEQVWTRPGIAGLIKDKFILVSLYVDDRGKLSKGQFTYRGSTGEKEIRTIGDKWATFQQENFNQVTQPLYVILSPEGELMNNPVGYTPNPGKYEQWLQCGLEAYAGKEAVVNNR